MEQPKSPQKLVTMQVSRRSGNINIRVQSDFDFSDMFDSGKTFKYTTAKGEVIKLRVAKHPKILKGFFNSIADNNALIGEDGNVNLSYISAEGIKNGVTFEIPTRTTISADDLSKFCNMFKEQLAKIYATYFRPFDREVEICIMERRAL